MLIFVVIQYGFAAHVIELFLIIMGKKFQIVIKYNKRHRSLQRQHTYMWFVVILISNRNLTKFWEIANSVWYVSINLRQNSKKSANECWWWEWNLVQTRYFTSLFLLQHSDISANDILFKFKDRFRF